VARVQRISEPLPFSGIVEEILEAAESMLDLAAISHAISIAHPESFRFDDVESDFSGCVSQVANNSGRDSPALPKVE